MFACTSSEWKKARRNLRHFTWKLGKISLSFPTYLLPYWFGSHHCRVAAPFTLLQSVCPCMESYFFFCVRCSSASVFTVLERIELSIWTKNSECSEVIGNWKSSPLFTIAHFISHSSKSEKRYFNYISVFFINTSCFCLHEFPFEDHSNSHFSFRSSQLVSWNILSLVLINPWTFLLTYSSNVRSNIIYCHPNWRSA